MKFEAIISLSLAILLLVITCPALAQEDNSDQAKGSIEGKVMTRGEKAMVMFADVRLEGTNWATMTDEKGRYRFELVEPGTYTLKVREGSIKDYSVKVEVKSGETTKQNCYVARSGYVLDEVMVVGKKEPEAMSRQELSKEELTGVPGANNDPIRVIESLPGTANTSVAGFGNDGLVIRGSSTEDSSYKLNGIDIPQLFHFGGGSTIINSELVDDIVYYPGAFSVKYGDSTAGVVEVTTRKPNSERMAGLVDINTYATYGVFEGPVNDKISMAGAFRRSFIDFILPAVVPDDELELTVVPRFYDYQGIFNYEINNRNELRLGVFGSDDGMAMAQEPRTEDPFSANSFNMRIAWHQLDAHWQYRPSAKVINELTATGLYYDTNFEFGSDMNFANYGFTATIKDDVLIELNEWNELRAGAEVNYFDFTIDADVPYTPKEGDPGFDSSSENIYELILKDYALSGGVYLEDVMTPFKWLTFMPGVRTDYHSYIEKFSVDPRATLQFHLTEKFTLKTSTGLYHRWPDADEFIEDYGTPDLKPEQALLYSAGADYNFGKGTTIDLQGYYKDLSDLVSQPEDEDADEMYNNDGKGHVYGAEFLARKKLTDRFMGWVSYTYSVSKRKDNDQSEWRYFDEDQTHNFIVLASYQLGKDKDWRLGAKWQFSSGLPYTEIDTAIYNADTDSYIPVYSEDVNEERNDPYHQLDLRVDKNWMFKRWTLNTYLDVQNVYMSDRTLGYRYNFNYTDRKPVTWFALYPTIGVQGRF